MIRGALGVCFGHETSDLDSESEAFFSLCFADGLRGTAHTAVLLLIRGGEIFIVRVWVTLSAGAAVLRGDAGSIFGVEERANGRVDVSFV